MANKSFAERILYEVELRDWSLSTLSRRADLSRTAVGDVISGRREPGVKFLKGLSQAFDIPLAEIISWMDGTELNEAADWKIWKDLLSQFTPENRQRYRRIMESDIEYRTRKRG